MSATRHVALALVLVCGLALAGCTLSPQDSTYPSDSEIRSDLTSLETLEADLVTRSDGNGTETTTRVHVVRNFTAGSVRSTVVSADRTGTTFASNGSRTWYYNPVDNSVRVYDGLANDTSSIQRTVDRMTELYDALRNGGDSDDSVGISPAPTVPSGVSQPPPSRLVSIPLAGNVSVLDEGTATVDGRSARVVRLVATGGVEYVSNATYWIDQEWHFPVKSRVAVQVGNETTTVTSTYTNVTYNQRVEHDVFTFDPPATATIVEGIDGSLRNYTTRPELEDATPHAVPSPDLPRGYEFRTGQLSPVESSQSITTIHASESDTITVTKVPEYEATLDGDAERVTVGGKPGRVVSAGANTAVVWTCDGNTYSVVGAADSVPLRDVAASMTCA